MKLVVVESPGKIKKIQSYLPRGYKVVASYGHVRDLPERELGVEFRDGRAVESYLNNADPRGNLKALKAAAKEADEVILATDPDREGEAIAWHVCELLKLKGSPARMVFSEITKAAVKRALEEQRRIDMSLVNAQRARRVLDRLVGYRISPFCWDKVGSGTSAGRVQTVALRLVAEREREIQAFVPEDFFDLFAFMRTEQMPPENPTATEICEKLTEPPPNAFRTKLIAVDGVALERTLKEEVRALDLQAACVDAQWAVTDVQQKQRLRRPPPPFITSTLQQAASNRLGWKPKDAMSVAQKLYEAGLITYMRTDSPFIAAEAIASARSLIKEKFAPNYLPEKPRYYKAKAAAQEAHECVRPTDVRALPWEQSLGPREAKLYRLIWDRFLACQMTDAVYDDTVAKILATTRGPKLIFEARGSVQRFDGWLRVTQNFATADRKKANEDDEAEGELPPLAEGQELWLARIDLKACQTKPPKRYSQASLIRVLEKEGVGRPATYAAILDNILSRGYIAEEDKSLLCTALGLTLIDTLVRGFEGHFVEIGFTREAEEALDRVAQGREDWAQLCFRFNEDIEKLLAEAKLKVPRLESNAAGAANRKTGEPVRETCPKCGSKMLRISARGSSFLACSNDKECRYTGPDLSERQKSLLEKLGVTSCPKCAGLMAAKESVKKDCLFLSCLRYPECNGAASVPGSEGTVSEKQRGSGGGTGRSRPAYKPKSSSRGGFKKKTARKKSGTKRAPRKPSA